MQNLVTFLLTALCFFCQTSNCQVTDPDEDVDIYVPKVGGQMKNTVICQGIKRTLLCTNSSMVLVINKATYGRTEVGDVICSYNSKLEKEDTDDKSLGCQEDVTPKIRDVCHKRNTCKVPATKKFLGQPCKGIYKYMSIIYACASKVSLSCYECSPEGMGSNGTGTPLINCNAPKQRKCSNFAPNMPYDRCMTIKATVKNPNSGTLLEHEYRNCSFSRVCSGNLTCNSMNSTGTLVKCDVQCCESNLCNGRQPQTTAGSSPTGGHPQTTAGSSPTGGHPQTTAGSSPTGGHPQTTVEPSPTGTKSDYSSCGLRSVHRGKIFGGHESRPGMWPWQVAILRGTSDENQRPQFICGGALINSRWVLSAAHCFHKRRHEKFINYSYTIKAGEHKIFSKDPHEKERHNFRIHNHPNFVPSTYENDIALIELDKGVKMGPYVRSICLPKVNVNLSEPGDIVSVAGWRLTTKSSYSPVLLHSAFEIQSKKNCKDATSYLFDETVMFCVGHGKGGNDTCKGDSGSSTVREVLQDGRRRWVTVGLVSWDEGCGIKGKYGYYARVEPFVNWIHKKINGSLLSCGDPGNIQNGRIIGSDFLVGFTVKYICNKGYQLRGNSKSRCQRNGNWTKAPTCEIECKDHASVRYGVRRPIKKTYYHKDKVQFRCKTNYTIIGVSEMVCRSDGTWSGYKPACLAPCKDPGIPEGGDRLDHSFKHGQTVRFLCRKTNKSASPVTFLTCINGRWNQNIPTCIEQVRTNVRLPDNAVPTHYTLRMNIDPDREDFSGEEEIQVNIRRSTSTLIIHSKTLNITDVAINKKQGSSKVKRHYVSKLNDFYYIETESSLAPGQYLLKMAFKGLFRKDLNGLYKGYFRKPNGTIAYFASTLFKPLEARSMFPCFDEPALKATYNITVIHPKDMLAFSNSDVKDKKEERSYTVSSFKTTPKMSTYLVSITVGSFTSSKEMNTTKGVKIRILGQPGREDQMGFALKMADETLVQLEEAFDIAYPMQKLDLIALPESFTAMEDWGLVHFEEDSLLYKKDISSEQVQTSLLMRWLPHKIVHQWFGNLVTMKWWDDIWLNEAFADYFNYFDASPKSVSSWKRDVLFTHTNVGTALELDAFVNTRKVIATPKELNSAYIFDDIICKKGSSLLRMLKNTFYDQSSFDKAIKNYLKKFSYKSTVESDIYCSLQESCPKKDCGDITIILEPWLTTPGYPVVTLSKHDSKPNTYVLRQERFVYDKNANVDNTSWEIYVKYVTGHKDDDAVTSNFNQWLIMSQPEGVEIAWDGEGWLKGNSEQTGFYRMNYDAKTWKSLIEQLAYKHTIFTEADRYGLIDDAFNLARGGRLNITTALSLIGYLRNETSYLPWLAVQKNVQYILGILPVQSKAYRQLKRFLAYQSKPVYDKLGTSDTGSHLDKLLRLVVAGFQCDAGLESCFQYTKDKFTAWKNHHMTTSITPALRELVYYYGVRQGDRKDWQQVLEAVQTTTVPSEIQPLLMGLAGSTKQDVLLNYLQQGQNQSIIKQQYAKYMYDFVANRNPVGHEVALNFILSRPNLIGRITVISRRFSSKYHMNLIKGYIEQNLNGEEILRQFKKALELVKLNVAWLDAHENDLANWLDWYTTKYNLAADDGLYEAS